MVAAVLGRWLGQSREGGGFCLPHTASRKISLGRLSGDHGLTLQRPYKLGDRYTNKEKGPVG